MKLINPAQPEAQKPAPLRSPKARALVIRVGALGDVLLTRRLTYSLSLQGITSTLLAPLRHASLLAADAWIDDVLDCESPAFAEAFNGHWPIPSRTFDRAVVISQSEEIAQAAATCAAVLVRLSPKPGRDDAPVSQQWAEAAGLGGGFQGILPPLPVKPPRAKTLARASFLHPGSGSAAKNWPATRFLDLARALQSAGHRVVWIRGPAEAEFERPGDGEVLDQPSLGQLAEALAQARLYVGNDSGVSHLAAAVGAPTLALFGPTNDRVWRPDGSLVVTLRSASLQMDDLSLETVLGGIDELA